MVHTSGQLGIIDLGGFAGFLLSSFLLAVGLFFSFGFLFLITLALVVLIAGEYDIIV